MSWLSEWWRDLWRGSLERQVKRTVTRWLLDEARPWITERLVEAGLERGKADELAARICAHIIDKALD